MQCSLIDTNCVVLIDVNKNNFKHIYFFVLISIDLIKKSMISSFLTSAIFSNILLKATYFCYKKGSKYNVRAVSGDLKQFV